MTKRALGILIAMISIVLLGVIVWVTKPKNIAPIRPVQSSKNFRSADIAKHSSPADCWTIIDNGVYDITKYISNHPGGEEILRACGKDATAMFKTRRDGQERIGSGTPHSSSANETLKSFRIGSLVN